MRSRFGKPHVCVVGAGASGLRCAEILLENGWQVTILEARNRIGGRICQSDKLGYSADIGPNWIHSSETKGRSPMFDLARKTNTPLHKWNDKQNIFNSSGSLIPAIKADELSSFLWTCVEEAMSYSAKNGHTIPASASLKDFLRSKVLEKFPGREEQELLMQMAEMWGAYIGDEVGRQSLKFVWMEQCCGGDGEMFVETTWAAILDEMARIPLQKADVKLGVRVVGVKTSTRESGSQVVVTTDKGDDLAFDEVLMTTPLGWLKRNERIFQPALPPRVLAGINGVSVGHLEKVYITFPKAFWLSPPPTSPNPALSPTEISHANDTFPGYTNWLAPTYTPTTNSSRFPIECFNLASFTPPNAHPTIIFYLYGACSSHIINLVHNTSSTTHHALLSAFFMPYISLLPNYSASNPDCEPKAILSTEWQKDEFSGYGSYCNFQVGTEDAKGDVEAMRWGVPERRLWFAGEHTAPFEECGTVAGAYLSGEAVAGRMLRMYEVKARI